MNDVATPIRDSILAELLAADPNGADPRPPESYFMSSIEMMAMSVFERNSALLRWMRSKQLDPDNGPDAVLGLGLLLALDAHRHPREAIQHYEMPDDHDH